jgi:hypothetical protein
MNSAIKIVAQAFVAITVILLLIKWADIVTKFLHL